MRYISLYWPVEDMALGKKVEKTLEMEKCWLGDFSAQLARSRGYKPIRIELTHVEMSQKFHLLTFSWCITTNTKMSPGDRRDSCMNSADRAIEVP